jgi:hypothetical protein
LEKAAKYLTSKKSMEILFQKVGIPESEPLPESFQILFKVEGLKFDTGVGDAEAVAFRPLSLHGARSRSAKAGSA